MWLTLGNLNTKAANFAVGEREWLSGYLSFDNAQARYIKNLRGDGKIHMFNMFSDSFPTGFVPLVIDAAQREGFKVEILDRRRKPCEPDPQADLGWLRDYQTAAVAAVVDKTRGIIWISTGGGKTEVFAGLTQRLPCRWLFLVHRNTLVIQAAERVERRTGLRVGRIGEGRWEGFSDNVRVVCASFQTLYARKRSLGTQDLLEAAEGLCCDESHCVPAESLYGVTMSTPNAYYRVGLSGTPLARGDRRSVLAIATLGKVIYRIKPDVLIEAGVLAKPRIRMIPIHQEADNPTWQGVYGELVVRSRQRNAAVVAAVKAAEKPCLVFVRELKHGRLLEQQLGKAGLSVSFVSGQHSTEWRASHLKRLERGHFDALLASVVLQEGVDIPDLRSVVVACGGASVIAALQRIGRGMRVAAGKSTFEVWDFADAGQNWMERHARARRLAYSREGFQVTEETPVIGAVA